MPIVNKTYRYRLYPDKRQISLLAQHFGSVRFVYNYFLVKRKEQYELTGKRSSYYEQQKDLTALKSSPTHLWLKDVNSQSLQCSLRNLETAYVNFFKKNC